ncbi:MAG: hypothetical protein EPO45_11010 [Sphingobium sp.]|nr:hypothetical protein [Alphaproteobacteria bacterium]MBU0868853.1 hypothetical protein [Alphaproteobacteria bacterium]MBU1257562.1 hypothetical protein [Alphaproteobacteria bacterium]TAJ76662.1 MAG: hypothetical protein EPO45_11010 [Sphingobium sp.]
MNVKDTDPMSLIDEFMLDEIFSDDSGEIEEGALEALRRSLEGAELSIRKRRMTELRMQIDNERRISTVIEVDAVRMRAKLKAAANDPDLKMTLAARNAVGGGDDEEEGLLEDLAELERDEAAKKE